ncbi:hypothetical protein MWU75_11110 [Ornithinimicrobium sp. F0845]|uniref:hypothetical protein n=1 Tax=Ornithinimicrobium sp. F0845 TaxID=2926412 RepID=UPI001FF29A82|nr:hypothetical protein [Ornithinimicrobium sp. F0845]MCK0112689.1 hypothetical protein [Ornithinimicrobium sp. F0845]
MGKDELRNALDHAAGHGPEVDFTGTWGAGRRMRRRRQAAQGVGGLALAASLVGAFALGGGDLMSRDSLGPATPTVPDDIVATAVETDSDDTEVTSAPPTPIDDETPETTATQEQTQDPTGSPTGSPTGTAAPEPAEPTQTDPVTTPSPTTGPTRPPTTAPTPTATGPTTDPGSDLIVLPNPCDEPTTGLTVMGVPDATPATMERAQELLDLASTCDLDGLIALATDQSTTLSFGNTTPEEAFAGELGRQRVHVLASLLVNYPPELGGGNDGPVLSARWPLLDEDQWPELVELGIATPQDLDSWESLGAYTGWRIFIEDDGLWSGMLAGD